MTIDECFQFARIAKPHGLKGELMATLLTENIEHLKNLKMIFLEINAKLVPFFIEKLTIINKAKVVLQLEDLHSEAEAEAFAGVTIYAPLANLPTLGKDQFYYHQVIGYNIQDANLGQLGVVDQIYEMPGQDLIAVIYQGSEVLIPINNHIVLKADHASKTVYVNLPEGLLDLYTENNEAPHED